MARVRSELGNGARDALIADALAAELQSQVDRSAALFDLVLQSDRRCTAALLGLARARLRQQRVGDALRLVRRALAIAPTDADAHDLHGSVLQALGHWGEAVAAHRAALARVPDAAAVRARLARALARSGDAAAALPEYEAAWRTGGDAAVASEWAGLLMTTGQPAAARAVLEAAIARTPGDAALHSDLGVALAALGEAAAALAEFRAAVALAPGHADAQNNLGVALREAGDAAAAEAAFRAALAARPDFVEAHHNLAALLQAAGRHAAAIDHLSIALAARPDFAAALVNLGASQAALGDRAAALASLERAVALAPHLADARNNLGLVLQALQREAEAARQFAAAVELDPVHAAAWNNLAVVDRLLGRLAEARRAAARAVALAPDEPGFLATLASCGPIEAGDPALARMARLAADPAIAGPAALHLRFAVARLHAEQGRAETGFDMLCAANRQMRAATRYDEAAALDELARIRALFGPALLARHRGAGDPSTRPIFIVGLPRSGGTLIEQILASHPAVHGAGELMLLQDLVRTRGGFPDWVADASPAAIAALGRDYVAEIGRLDGAAQHVTDKMPANFRLVGLIALALPGARIIHVRRDPVDCCLSCFATLFAGDVPYAYDLGELGRYHAAYRRVMAHWRGLLDPAQLLEIDYEAVVADLEGETRRILRHCGLPWDPGCLEFHRTERVVRTASAAQVRQPLNRAGIGRWRLPRSRLAPLLDGLALDAP